MRLMARPFLALSILFIEILTSGWESVRYPWLGLSILFIEIPSEPVSMEVEVGIKSFQFSLLRFCFLHCRSMDSHSPLSILFIEIHPPPTPPGLNKASNLSILFIEIHIEKTRRHGEGKETFNSLY